MKIIHVQADTDPDGSLDPCSGVSNHSLMGKRGACPRDTCQGIRNA